MENNVVYTYGGGLYINLTNRCTNKCEFCVRQVVDGLGGAESLWLEHEPTVEEIVGYLKKVPLEKYEEIIFCGYGEPTMRLADLLEVCKYLKECTKIKIRVNTNGLADLIYKRETAPMMKDLVDRVSVSLNQSNAEAYDDLCHPEFGKASYGAILTYIQNVKKYVAEVTVSVVSCISAPEVEECRRIANSLGVKFKVR